MIQRGGLAMEDIRGNLEKVRQQIRQSAEGCGRSQDDVLLVAVSKTRTPEEIIDKVSMIHSVDSYKLAAEINKRAAACGITMDILLQVNSAQEESKFGISTEETEGLIMQILDSCENIRIRGLMCIAPYADDPEDIKKYFDSVKEQYDQFSTIDHPNLDFRYLSMGMSHDFPVAIEAGSNLVRVGSAIFGERDYSKV